jgi:hypothetical protein
MSQRSRVRSPPGAFFCIRAIPEWGAGAKEVLILVRIFTNYKRKSKLALFTWFS